MYNVMKLDKCLEKGHSSVAVAVAKLWNSDYDENQNTNVYLYTQSEISQIFVWVFNTI